jgi:hypothetical protein
MGVHALDLDAYRRSAAAFHAEINREYYAHMAGLKPELEVETIYANHAELFEPHAVAELRERAEAAGDGDEERRLRYLTGFALEGCLGRETRAEAEELARLEATMEVEGPDGPIPYRGIPPAQANEAHAERRAELEAARDEVIGDRLNPVYRRAFERETQLVGELGWEGYPAAFGWILDIDLKGLAADAAAFLASTDEHYEAVMESALAKADLPEIERLRRSDLPRLFRAPELDSLYPQPQLMPSFTATLAGLGIDLASQRNVTLDTESRPTKSPRAFCATPTAPDEVYLVVSPIGGRDDYAALFHEGGHTEHFAHVDPGIGFEFAHLGDNSVTESFAFLLQHLTEEPEWLASRLGVDDATEAVEHSTAVRLYYLRRYAAKIVYELELYAAGGDLGGMPNRYAELLADATRARWAQTSWLADVDGGFYVACYLRAWALERRWRAALRERFGERWFGSPEAGGWLRSLWAQGQRLGGEELCREVLGEPLRFDVPTLLGGPSSAAL